MKSFYFALGIWKIVQNIGEWDQIWQNSAQLFGEIQQAQS
jgi:hypothetical protein